MKKFLAVVLVLAMGLSLLCACKKEKAPGAAGTAADATAPQEDNNPTDENSIETFDASTTANYFQDLTAPEVVPDMLSYQLYQAWWEEDTLILQIYFINGHDQPVSELWIDEMNVYNEGSAAEGDPEEEGFEEWNSEEGGLIASAQIGPVDEAMPPIEPGDYTLITFYLTGSCLEYPGADLASLSVEFTPDYTW